jgi:ABC-2 type transport system permease protein
MSAHRVRASWLAFQTILIKEVLRFLRIWVQTLVPPAVTTALYFLIFGRLIGAQLPPTGGLSYVDYIAPGVVLMAVITNSYSNVVSSFFSTKYQRYVEELLIAPVPSAVILAGYVCGGVLRGVAVAAVVSVVALPFAGLGLHALPVAAAALIATSTLFALGGFLNAVFARSFDDISVIPTFVLTPLTYLGGVFYSVEMLPSPWREISFFNPILYMVSAFRYGTVGVADVSLATAFAVIAAFIVALGAFALWVLGRGIGLKS